MGALINCSIKLKEKLDQKDYTDINNLLKLCSELDQTTLKLELDFKLRRAEGVSKNSRYINEFMYYDRDKLIGYIGICQFGGDAIEVNGMVHPQYRRRGIFRTLFSLAKDEWGKRESRKMLLLSDNDSLTGLGFIKNLGVSYDHSEYEMFLRSEPKQDSNLNNVILRKATNHDAKEIAMQNSVYFEKEYSDEDLIMPEEEEKCGTSIYLAEIDNKVIGKVHLETSDGIGGIYGLGVLPEYRKRGYGREILTLAIEKLKESTLKDIMLQVAVKNKNALNLYSSCGFEVTSRMEYYEVNKG